MDVGDEADSQVSHKLYKKEEMYAVYPYVHQGSQHIWALGSDHEVRWRCSILQHNNMSNPVCTSPRI